MKAHAPISGVRLLAIVAWGCGLAQVAVAQDNAAFIEQVGTQHLARQYQDGAQNFATIVQNGTANMQTVEQYGTRNTSTTSQDGTYLQSIIIQNGTDHTATVFQSSNAPPIRIQQFGTGQTIFLHQN